MAALGRWLGSWAGRWFGGVNEGEPPRHLIRPRSVVAVVRVGRPTVAPRPVEPPAPPDLGGWAQQRFIPPRHRILAAPVVAAVAVGAPRIGLRLRAGSAAAVLNVGRPTVRLRQIQAPPKPTEPRPDNRLAELIRQDEELMLWD